MCSGLHARYTDVDVGMVMVFTVAGVETVSTNAEYYMILITRNTVKMVAELRTWHGSMDPDTDGREDYSAVDKSCMAVAADPLSLIAFSP